MRRLTGVGSFATVLATGQRRNGRAVQVIAMPARLPTGRVGLVVGRKALPRAVDRNRMKRLLRVMLRAVRPGLDRYDVVVRVTKPLTRPEIGQAAAEAAALVAALAADPARRG